MASTVAAAKASAFVCGAPVRRSSGRVQSARRASFRVQAKYGEDSRYFDLEDLENTLGSWDLYGKDDDKRYNGLQSEFFERAAAPLSRREAVLAFVGASLGAATLVWGAKGAKDAKLPITLGPQKGGEPGPRGRL